MATTTLQMNPMTGPLSPADEAILAGVRRSRLSLQGQLGMLLGRVEIAVLQRHLRDHDGQAGAVGIDAQPMFRGFDGFVDVEDPNHGWRANHRARQRLHGETRCPSR